MSARAAFAAALVTVAQPATGLAYEDTTSVQTAITSTWLCMASLSPLATPNASPPRGPGPAPFTSPSLYLDSGAGRGCRVRYTGPQADHVWEVAVGLVRSPARSGVSRSGCRLSRNAADRVEARCIPTREDAGRAAPMRGADVLVVRSGAGAAATVTTTATPLRP